jgi:hypothetical protein
MISTPKVVYKFGFNHIYPQINSWYMKADQLDAVRLGFAFGVVWGVGLLFMGLISTYTGYAAPFVIIIGAIYPGYGNTLIGSFLGLLWGAVDGFIGGWLIAKLYNWHSHPHDVHLEKRHPRHVRKVHEAGWLPHTGRKKKRK